ncbi:MAG TPA: protein translocase subunit SecF, partial [Gammaproteobacteria bacterium]|nr:protein translocase subunit SecF [Gammaproteobacteria bacterium]
VQLHRVDFVGPQVGEDLREGAILATLIAMALILIYVAMRFQLRFAVGANVALLHDPIITIGFFSILGIEFDLTVLAAILAVIGYSINDTIVIFDRIREVFRKQRKASPVEVMNMAINQTLSRTIMTSWATLLVVITLFFFGGRAIHGFSIALIVGVLVGTYSSIFVASATALDLGVSRKDLMPVEKEGQPVEDRP